MDYSFISSFFILYSYQKKMSKKSLWLLIYFCSVLRAQSFNKMHLPLFTDFRIPFLSSVLVYSGILPWTSCHTNIFRNFRPSLIILHLSLSVFEIFRDDSRHSKVFRRQEDQKKFFYLSQTLVFPSPISLIFFFSCFFLFDRYSFQILTSSSEISSSPGSFPLFFHFFPSFFTSSFSVSFSVSHPFSFLHPVTSPINVSPFLFLATTCRLTFFRQTLRRRRRDYVSSDVTLLINFFPSSLRTSKNSFRRKRGQIFAPSFKWSWILSLIISFNNTGTFRNCFFDSDFFRVRHLQFTVLCVTIEILTLLLKCLLSLLTFCVDLLSFSWRVELITVVFI